MFTAFTRLRLALQFSSDLPAPVVQTTVMVLRTMIKNDGQLRGESRSGRKLFDTARADLKEKSAKKISVLN